MQTDKFKKTNDGKILLRTVMNKFVPPSIANGQKKAFRNRMPPGIGVKVSSIAEMCCFREMQKFMILDKKTTLGLVEEHLSGEQNRRLLLWSLLCVETWCQEFT